MELLFRPITRTWSWVELHWGFPGQVFFVLLILFFFLAVAWFLGNRGGGQR